MAGVETLRFVPDLNGLTFADCEGGRTETTVGVWRDGKWKHGRYGDITVNPEMRGSLVRNFQANVRKVGELPIDYDHQDGPAAEWIFGLRNEADRLLADVWLTPSGAKRVRGGEYRKFSPEWHPDWEDSESGKRYGSAAGAAGGSGRGGAGAAVRGAGERGFSGNEEPADYETPTASGEARLKKMADDAKLPLEEVRRQFLEVRKSRRAGGLAFPHCLLDAGRWLW